MNQKTHAIPFKLVIFDLDGVLVPIESSWQFIHDAFGCNNDINFNRYMKGEIDFQEFMRSDIALWNGASINKIFEILNKVTIVDGAQETMQILHAVGIRLAIVSSGISILADRIGHILMINRVYANRLIADNNGRLTGEAETVVPLLEKHIVIKKILEEEKVSSRECAIIGDNVFDIPHFSDIGLSIAFNSKSEESKVKADVSIEGGDLRNIIPWLTSSPPSKIIIRLTTTVKEAKSVMSALLPDNVKIPLGLYVKMYQKNTKIYVKIVSVRGLGTILSTVNDILSCSQLAFSSINVTKLH